MSIRSSRKTQNDIYLQDTVGFDKDGNEVTLQDKLADPEVNIAEQVTLKMQISVLCKKMKKILRPREKEILDLRYGLNGKKETTQREIANSMGISRSYVSRIEKKALNKLLSALNGE
ncbi:MAG: sigma-70 family RNA polymerase sigma factor [Firmicutes bacterium]|nr:sigma-70 family RNA polymerase sigma factor [Bacillota bacterium]